MKLRLACLVLGTVLLLTVVPLGAVGDDDATSTVIVLFEDEVDEDLVKDVGGTIEMTFDSVPALVAELSAKEVKELKKSDKVSAVEEDATVEAIGDDDDSSSQGKPGSPPTAPAAETTPWGIKQIHADDVAAGGNTGSGINVAVIDTGIDVDHTDLKVAGGCNFVSNRGKVDSTKYDDDNGHGTHCAGIIAALDNTIGVVGVAPGANLYAVKVLGKSGSGTMSNVIAGINWCIDTHTDATPDIDVISMSLGATSGSDTLKQACDNAKAHGIVVVAAAGNSGATGGGSMIYPAVYDSVISVGATDSSNVRASWSSYGSALDLVAPGVSIYSTYKGGVYRTMSGTSMACPHVAGTVALVLKTTPPTTYSSTWEPTEVQEWLESTATGIGTPVPNDYYGHGLVNALAATTTS